MVTKLSISSFYIPIYYGPVFVIIHPFRYHLRSDNTLLRQTGDVSTETKAGGPAGPGRRGAAGNGEAGARPVASGAAASLRGAAGLGLSLRRKPRGRRRCCRAAPGAERDVRDEWSWLGRGRHPGPLRDRSPCLKSVPGAPPPAPLTFQVQLQRPQPLGRSQAPPGGGLVLKPRGARPTAAGAPGRPDAVAGLAGLAGLAGVGAQGRTWAGARYPRPPARCSAGSVTGAWSAWGADTGGGGWSPGASSPPGPAREPLRRRGGAGAAAGRGGAERGARALRAVWVPPAPAGLPARPSPGGRGSLRGLPGAPRAEAPDRQTPGKSPAFAPRPHGERPPRPGGAAESRASRAPDPARRPPQHRPDARGRAAAATARTGPRGREQRALPAPQAPGPGAAPQGDRGGGRGRGATGERRRRCRRLRRVLAGAGAPPDAGDPGKDPRRVAGKAGNALLGGAALSLGRAAGRGPCPAPGTRRPAPAPVSTVAAALRREAALTGGGGGPRGPARPSGREAALRREAAWGVGGAALGPGAALRLEAALRREAALEGGSGPRARRGPQAGSGPGRGAGGSGPRARRGPQAGSGPHGVGGAAVSQSPTCGRRDAPRPPAPAAPARPRPRAPALGPRRGRSGVPASGRPRAAAQAGPGAQPPREGRRLLTGRRRTGPGLRAGRRGVEPAAPRPVSASVGVSRE
ncbi:collagen alpha-1(I) chain-like [Canis lupus dingo]|uniref:collagen alpha-1(I) chain-like n=1 Tax=Canis lupus dingo TaxID=286419 RepID=UPI0020C2451F|nr:collagen alpha-1(I) chain-like [Canis lupus dingo]